MQAAMEAAMAEAAARDSTNDLAELDQQRLQQQQQQRQRQRPGYMQEVAEEEPGLMEASSSHSVDPQELLLLQALQTTDAENQADVLQEWMRLNDQSDRSMESLLQFLFQPEQEPTRPTEHYLTIAQNGMILEATRTVTGFPPDALLMTSA